MSRKLSTRKRPARDVHMIKEQLKIEEGVFDNRTMMCLWRMFNHNIITRLDFIISRGKEADVYAADAGTGTAPERFVALKIFRYETSGFDKRIEYMTGDPRFERIKTGIFDIVNTWCKKEYGNLLAAGRAGVHAPRPYYFRGNVLAMELIGDEEGTPARTLKESRLDNAEEVLDTVLSDIKKLYSSNLVHSDISEYNILINKGIPYLIDFGQAVIAKHPKAEEFLERDVSNIVNYFSKRYGVKRDKYAALKGIRG